MSLDTSIFAGRNLCQLYHMLLLVKILSVAFVSHCVYWGSCGDCYHLDGSELFVAFFTPVPLAHIYITDSMQCPASLYFFIMYCYTFAAAGDTGQDENEDDIEESNPHNVEAGMYNVATLCNSGASLCSRRAPLKQPDWLKVFSSILLRKLARKSRILPSGIVWLLHIMSGTIDPEFSCYMKHSYDKYSNWKFSAGMTMYHINVNESHDVRRLSIIPWSL